LVLLFLSLLYVVVFLFCEYPLPGQQGAKAEELTDKFKQPSIKQFGILPFVLALEEITIISGTKKRNLVQVEWDDKKVLYNTQTIEGIAYENGKNYRPEKQML
jgi:hypothetical protein